MGRFEQAVENALIRSHSGSVLPMDGKNLFSESSVNWLNSLPEEKREAVFVVMRSIRQKSDYHAEQARRLSAPAGAIPVGSEDVRAFMKSEALAVLLRGLGKGLAPAEAAVAAKQEAAFIADKYKQRRPKDYQTHIWPQGEDSNIDSAVRSILKAAA